MYEHIIITYTALVAAASTEVLRIDFSRGVRRQDAVGPQGDGR